MRIVSVLCVSPKSVYHKMEGVEAYDPKRDARTFPGGTPIVAHPPCRSWSAHTAHQAKPMPGEKELGPWCVEMLKKCGGVLEHPAHSRLFDACTLPKPGKLSGFRIDGQFVMGASHSGLWTIEVWQAWWGYPMRKATWLCFCGVSPKDVHLPFRLHPEGLDRRREQLMGKTQRSATTQEMATWLVNTARNSNPP